MYLFLNIPLQSSSTLRPLLGTLASLLSNSNHCWTTRLTLGSEWLTNWKPVMLAPPFLRSVRSMSRKPWIQEKRMYGWMDGERKDVNRINSNKGAQVAREKERERERDWRARATCK